jgi:hypothetical protein
VSGIIWLASYPKSGNTWVRAFLANLLSNPKAPLPINDLPDYILGDNLLRHYEQYSGKKAEELTPEDVVKLRPKVHDWFAASRRDDVFVKTHNALLIVEGAPLITPSATAGAIYVVRNPLDVAVSFAHHYQVTYERAVESLCDENYYLPASSGQLPQYLSSWSRHLRSWTKAPGLTLHLMRYEDMTKAPVKAFGKLVKFLGLPKDPARLRKAIKFSSFRELARQEKRTAFVEARPDGKTPFFRAGQSGSWRGALTDDQVAALIDVHREAMVELGYLTRDGKPRI